MVEASQAEEGQYTSYAFGDGVGCSDFKSRFEPGRHDWILTVRFQIAVPRIVRLLRYDRIPRVRVKLNRRNLFARDQNHCQYCGRKFSSSELSLDHVVPRSQGGASSWQNLVCACMKCNVRKAGRTPRQAHMKLIAQPRRPRYSPVLTVKLSDSKYASWKQFLDYAYWNVELK